MAVWTPAGFALFRSDLTAVTAVSEWTCVGNGQYLGNYLASLLCQHSPLMAMEEIKPIAAYIVGSARMFIDGCGFTTYVHVTRDDGKEALVRSGEVRDCEKHFDGLFDLIRQYLFSFSTPLVMDRFPEMFAESEAEFRERQRKRNAGIPLS
jgi:hypothetical protein